MLFRSLFIYNVPLIFRTVPDGGYGEDEDCINAEDEEYRAVLERMEADGMSKVSLRYKSNSVLNNLKFTILFCLFLF